jgi:hypothetical protein
MSNPKYMQNAANTREPTHKPWPLCEAPVDKKGAACVLRQVRGTYEQVPTEQHIHLNTSRLSSLPNTSLSY